jgi:outer membrane protein TolC
MARAIQNYPAIRQYELIEQTTEFTLSNAGKAYLPQLSVTLIGGVIDGLPAMTNESSVDLKLISVIQFQQTIWDGGYTKANKAKISAEGQVKKAEVDVSMYALRQRVNELYFGILLIEAQQTQLAVMNQNLNTRLTQLQNAIASGAAYKTDEDELLVELLGVQEQKESLEYAKRAYLAVLSAMINTPLDEGTELAMPGDITLNFSGELYTPELRLLQAQQQQIDAQLGIQKSVLMPKIGLLGFGTFIVPGVDFGFSAIDQVLVGGLSVSWNLSGLYSNKNNKRMVETMKTQIQVNKETYVFNTNLQLTQKQLEILRLQNQILKDEELLALRSRIKTAYDTKYENGICTMADLLQAVNNESIATQTLSTHQLELLMKKYNFLFTQGIPDQNP